MKVLMVVMSLAAVALILILAGCTEKSTGEGIKVEPKTSCISGREYISIGFFNGEAKEGLPVRMVDVLLEANNSMKQMDIIILDKCGGYNMNFRDGVLQGDSTNIKNCVKEVNNSCYSAEVLELKEKLVLYVPTLESEGKIKIRIDKKEFLVELTRGKGTYNSPKEYYLTTEILEELKR